MILTASGRSTQVAVVATAPSSSTRVPLKVTFKLPSGLLVVDAIDRNGENMHICVLQHNIVGLRPDHARVKELKSVLSSKQCAKIITDANSYSAGNGGWTNCRHTNYATTDIPVELLYGENNHIECMVEDVIFPEFAAYYGLNRDFLHILGECVMYWFNYLKSSILTVIYNMQIELFIVKYESLPGEQSLLTPHLDGTPWSFVVALNDATEYVGGGTHFIPSNTVYRPQKAGTAVLFSGKNLHEGLEVTGGVRYILTGFCEYACDYAERSPHENFLCDYDQKYDGNAAHAGIHTGDVIKGIYDVHGELHTISVDRTIHSVLETCVYHHNNTNMSTNPQIDDDGIQQTRQYSLMLERLCITDYIDDESDDNNDNENENEAEENKVKALSLLTDASSYDRIIIDLMHNVDHFLSVGQYWKFDAE